MNTACYRIYVGTWELIGGELFLKSVSRTEWTDPNTDPVAGEILLTRKVVGRAANKASP